MATIADLNVKLSANILGFTTGMRSALKPLSDFGKGIGSVGAMVTGFAGLVGGGLTIAGLVAFTHSQMEAIDSTAKLSDRLGISTEALTGLQHAANLSGVSAEGLTGSLEKMLKSLSEATQGSAAQAGAFQALGLNAAELANMAPDEAFKHIADGLVNIKNPATRAALAMEIFGKSGQQLLPLMLSGSEGIAAAQQEAQKLGLTFSRLDAAKVEAANDAITKLQGAFTGAGQALAIQLAPFITVVADKLTGVAASGEGMGAKVVNVFENVLKAVATLADWLELLKAGWYAMQGVAGLALGGLTKMIGLVIQGIEWLTTKLGGTNQHFGEFARMWGDEMVAGAKESFNKAGESWDTFASGRNASAVTAAFAQIRSDADAAAKKIADNAKNLNGAAAATNDWAKSFQDAKKRAEDIQKTMEGLQTDLATFGMNEGQKKLFDLKALGADPAQLEQARNLIKQLDAKKVGEELSKMGDDLHMAGRSDIDKKLFDLTKLGATTAQLAEAKKKLQDINIGEAFANIEKDLETAGMSDTQKKLFDLKRLGASPEQLEEAKKKLQDIALAEAKPHDAPKLMLSGSAEAQKLAYEATIGIKSTKDDVARKQLNQQELTNKQLAGVRDDLKGLAVPAYA